MKRGLTLLLIGIFLLMSLEAQSADRTYLMDETGFQIRVLDNGIFGQGEQFIYDVYYGIVPAGSAGIEILPQLVTYRQAPCYHIYTWARSAKAFNIFFKVEDEVHSYLDARGIFTWYFEKRLNEGKYHDVKVVDYDQRQGFAYMTNDGVPSDTSWIPLFVQDAISALYYFRLQPLKVGKPLYIQVHDIRKTYPLKIDVLAYETIEVPAGTFNCYKVEPVLESAGIFKSKGQIFIWFTDDQFRVPVQMKTKVLIGSITAYLKEFSRGTPVEHD